MWRSRRARWFAIGLLLMATYWVKTTGSNSNNGSEASPWLTIAFGLSTMAGGDTLRVGPGVYVESAVNAIKTGGGSWATATVLMADTASDKPIMRPSGSNVMYFSNRSWNIIDGIVLDAVNTTDDGCKITDDAHHIRFIRCEVKNADGNGILLTPGGVTPTPLRGGTCEFIDSIFHDNGVTGLAHGLYISTSENLVEGCEFYSNFNWGIHLYGGNGAINNNVVRKNISRNNAQGIVVQTNSGTGNLIYNNLVYDNTDGSGAAIKVGGDLTTTAVKIYNNTVYSNNSFGIFVGSNASTTEVKNNISYSNTGANIQNNGTNTTLATNLTTDPSFVNAAAFNFNLQAGSTARDAGTTLADVTDDFDGRARPQGVAYDIGAYEFATTPSYSLSLDTGAHLLSGSTAASAFAVGVVSGTYAEIGADLERLAIRLIDGGSGTYSANGTTASADFVMGAVLGNYDLPGVVTDLVYGSVLNMAAYNKFQDFVEQTLLAKHDFSAAGHVFKIFLTNEAPLAADTVKADMVEISAVNGYTAGGTDTANTLAEASENLVIRPDSRPDVVVKVCQVCGCRHIEATLDAGHLGLKMATGR